MTEVRDEQASTQGSSPLASGLPTLTYSQTQGLVLNESGTIVAEGWSGNHTGKNNPDMQAAHNVGPLPQGLYRVGQWQDHPRLGPMVVPLTQIEGETFGRSDFWIHGPSTAPSRYGQESEGCIVLPRADRQHVHDLNPGFVRVVA